MLIINRYIAKTLLIATFFVVIVVTFLSFFITLLGELKDIGVGDYGFLQAMKYTFLSLPSIVYQFFPMLVLVGGMIGLGILSASRELIVIRTSGFSIYNILTAAIVAAVVLILFSLVIGEYIGPHAKFIAETRKDSEQNNGQAVATASGVWIHEGTNFLHIDKVNGVEHLEGVTRYEFDANHKLLAAYYVQSLNYDHGHWQLHDVVKTVFTNDHTASQKQASDTWNLSLNPNLLNVGLVSPEEMSLPRLLSYSRHLVANKSQAGNFQFEFWKRVFQPLMTIVMIMLAVPFAFGSPRSVTMGWRILFGVMVGFAFYILNAMFGQFSVVYQVPPFIAALFPTLLFACAGYILMLKVR